MCGYWFFTGAGEKAFVAGPTSSDFPKMNPLQARLLAKEVTLSLLRWRGYPFR